MPRVLVRPDQAGVAETAAALLAEDAAAAIELRGHAVWVAAGGSTPVVAYRILAEQYAASIPWADVTIAMGDERCVPLDDPDSNWGQLTKTLLDRVTDGAPNLDLQSSCSAPGSPAGICPYALAEDTIGLARFREKYAPLMSGDADRAAFETASKPAAANSAEFDQIAKMAARVDTLDGFLREMKARFPDVLMFTSPEEPVPALIRPGR